MTQENKKLDYSELKDTDPIISYEQSEEAECFAGLVPLCRL